MKLIYPLLTGLLVLLHLSCTEQACDLDTEAFLNAGFYSAETAEEISLDSLTIYGINREDSLIYSMANTGKAALPLDPSGESCSFIIKNGDRTDTLSFQYIPEMIFLSTECGYIYNYRLSDITYSLNEIENILTINENVKPGDEENIQIFF